MASIISELELPVKSGNKIEYTKYQLPSGGGAQTPEAIGFGYGTCETAYITAEKAVVLDNYVLTKNGIVAIYFKNAVGASATLNINGTGAKPIYHRGSAITTDIIKQDDIATFIYDGNYFQLISLNRSLAVATTTSIGSASTGTAIPADDITAWNAGTAASASVSGTKLTINNGTAPTLSYTAKSIPNISVTDKTVVTDVK